MNHHENMRLLSMHPNHYKFFTSFSFSKRKEKMSSLSTKERKAKFNTNGLIFRKKFNLPSGTLLSAEWNSIEHSSTKSLTNKHKLFGAKSKLLVFQIYQKTFFFSNSKKYIMIEELKDELKSLTNIFNEIKKLELLREQEINEIKKETKRKLNMLDDEVNDILEKLDKDLTTLTK